ncbi:ATP-binding protein [Actinoplanes sp. TFC3]|uniref:ATP-binding protein n=1 Tax=Actinoplanes sp. TFC3 TaxID=1710355 RepID=UPI00082DD3AA|nr:ATP-binding protein [Actinoplanes sp. TFC3]
MSTLQQAPPPDAEVVCSWVLASTVELKGLRRSLNLALRNADTAAGDHLGDVPERMVLVATELATNAIRHGLAPTEIRLLRTGELYVLDVADHDVDTIPEPSEAQPQDSGGRGLALARSFALDVGWYCTTTTKHVWASFTPDA